MKFAKIFNSKIVLLNCLKKIEMVAYYLDLL